MRLALQPRASPSNLKGICKPSPSTTAGIWVLSRILTPETSGKDEDKSGELRNTASSCLLGLESKCSCQNHEWEWTLTWVATVNGLSLLTPAWTKWPAPAFPACPWERASLWSQEGSKSQGWWHKTQLSSKKSSEINVKKKKELA